MFDKVYRIAIEADDFEELKEKLKTLDINAKAVKNNFLVTVGAQLAIEEQHDKVEWMRQLGANVSAIACGYALAGNHNQVEIYREKHGAKADAIAYGYALAGHNDQVEVYCGTHKASVDVIAEGYARVGNDDKVELYRLKHGANVKAIAEGYARAGNHDKQKKYDINYLLDSYLKERTEMTHSGVTKEYLHRSVPSFFQKSFTQKKAAVDALKSALEGKDVNLSEHSSTLRNGTLGKELRAFIKSGMGSNLVGKEVTTVSDFVLALQDKNVRPRPGAV